MKTSKDVCLSRVSDQPQGSGIHLAIERMSHNFSYLLRDPEYLVNHFNEVLISTNEEKEPKKFDLENPDHVNWI